MAAETFEKPPKAVRETSGKPVPDDGLVRVKAQETANAKNSGNSPVARMIEQGYAIDEASRSHDGTRFDLVIPRDQFEAQSKRFRQDALDMERASIPAEQTGSGARFSDPVVVAERVRGAEIFAKPQDNNG